MNHLNSRRFLLASLLAGLVGLASAMASAQSAVSSSDHYRVVIQVSDNDPAKWNLALNNARNVQVDLGMDNVDVEVVAYGPGLAMLKADSPVASRIASAPPRESVSSPAKIRCAARKWSAAKSTPAYASWTQAWSTS